MSLSTDDPPLLTALAAGHATITAGTGSADVTVSAGPLPLGTVIWSNPGDGSGVTSIVPAVPSTTGVADVFAFQADGTVAAITADGKTAWTASSGNNAGWSVVPDFQGGLVAQMQSDSGGASIVKFDGITGQAYPAYTLGPTSALNYAYPIVVHPDGTIFAVQDNWTGPNNDTQLPTTVVGIDPTTGAQKFSVPIAIPAGHGAICPGGMIIAGDGYAYVAYGWTSDPALYYMANHLRVLRLDSSGNSGVIDVADWGSDFGEGCAMQSVGMITNADQGILITWDSWGTGSMATTAGVSASLVGAPQVPGWGSEQPGIVTPVLQAQDGSFVGVYYDESTYKNDMVAFDAGGNVRWIVPNETPQIATADGGVIGQSGITYDQSGNATGMINTATQSWRGNEYQGQGSVQSVVGYPIPEDEASFWSTVGGNPSGNGTAFVQCPCLLQSSADSGSSGDLRKPPAEAAVPLQQPPPGRPPTSSWSAIRALTPWTARPNSLHSPQLGGPRLASPPKPRQTR